MWGTRLQAYSDDEADDDGGDVDEEVLPGVGGFVGRVDVEHVCFRLTEVRGLNPLKVLGCKACLLSDTCEHFRADLVGVVEGPGEVRIAFATELLVRAALDDMVFYPTDTQ
jgi:hypothetical protein